MFDGYIQYRKNKFELVWGMKLKYYVRWNIN